MIRFTTALTAAILLLATPAAAATGEAGTPPDASSAPLRLTLAQAIEKAQASSPHMDSLRALEEARAAGVDGARAGRMPQADLTASYTRNSNVPELVLAAPGQPPRTIFPNIPDNWYSRVGVTLPLYTGGRVGSLIDAAEKDRSAAGEDVATGQADLVLEVTAAYWDLVTARASESVLEEALRSYDAHVTDARNRESHGLAARNEVLAVSVERDRAELARLRAANGADVAEADLVRLIGAAPGTHIQPADALEGDDAGAGATEAPAAPEGGVEKEDAGPLVEQALANRPERRALAERAAAAESRSRAARADRLPQVRFNAGYDYARPNRRILPLTDTWNDTWDASVVVGYRFFDGGRTRAAVTEQAAQAAALRSRLEDVDRKIRLEVTQRLLDLDTARAAVSVAGRNLAAARENQRVASERYHAGVIPSSELLDAETALLHAGLDRTSALATVRVASARLDRAVGR